MFELTTNAKGEKVLVYVRRPRMPFERGMWVEIAHENDKEARFLVSLNRQHGLQIERDEKGFFRALVLKD